MLNSKKNSFIKIPRLSQYGNYNIKSNKIREISFVSFILFCANKKDGGIGQHPHEFRLTFSMETQNPLHSFVVIVYYHKTLKWLLTLLFATITLDYLRDRSPFYGCILFESHHNVIDFISRHRN